MWIWKIETTKGFVSLLYIPKKYERELYVFTSEVFLVII